MDLVTNEISNEAMRIRRAAFSLLPDHFKTQEMCIKAVEEYPWDLDNVPDHSKTHKMCKEKVVWKDWWYIVGIKWMGKRSYHYLPLHRKTYLAMAMTIRKKVFSYNVI